MPSALCAASSEVFSSATEPPCRWPIIISRVGHCSIRALRAGPKEHCPRTYLVIKRRLRENIACRGLDRIVPQDHFGLASRLSAGKRQARDDFWCQRSSSGPHQAREGSLSRRSLDKLLPDLVERRGLRLPGQRIPNVFQSGLPIRVRAMRQRLGVGGRGVCGVSLHGITETEIVAYPCLVAVSV